MVKYVGTVLLSLENRGEGIMEIDILWDILERAGYIGLFLWLWLSVFGAPLPNEVIAMTIGLAASEDVFHPVATFFVTFFGIVAALTTAYSLGRFVGRPLITLLRKRKRFARLIERSLVFLEKHHAYSLFFSYFFPGLRNFVPFMYGVSKLPFKTFMLFAYLGAFAWLTITFNLGYWFGEHRDIIFQREKEGFIVFVVVFILFIIYKWMKKTKEPFNTMGEK